MLASYGHLLAHDVEFAAQSQQFSARVRDVSQQLETITIEQASGTTEVVTYDASCHLLYGQHAGEAPLRMLGASRQLNFARLEGSERCCGGAGCATTLSTASTTMFGSSHAFFVTSESVVPTVPA